MPDPLNPFTDDDFNKLEEALKNSTLVEEAINKAKRAGIELPGLLDDVKTARTRLMQIKNTYQRPA